MEPIKCSPETKINGVFERHYVENDCSPECPHYQECLNELGLKNFNFPKWIERGATPEEIECGFASYDFENNRFYVPEKVIS